MYNDETTYQDSTRICEVLFYSLSDFVCYSHEVLKYQCQNKLTKNQIRSGVNFTRLAKRKE